MRGSSTLCSAVARGSRLKVWNTNPISLLRMRASASSSRSETFWALSQYSPDVGVSRQPIRFMSVDLPDPDGPITATRSEEHTSELQSRRDLVCRLLLEKKKKNNKKKHNSIQKRDYRKET